MRPLLLTLLVLFMAWPAAASNQGAAAPAAEAGQLASQEHPKHQAPPLNFTVSADPKALDAIESRFGVQVIGVRLAAGGYMLDFRYKVVDPEKAAPLVSQDNSPYLLDPKTGTRTVVPASPKFGSLKPLANEPLIPGRNYFMMFANPGKRITKGQEVSVVIGEFKAERLVVN